MSNPENAGACALSLKALKNIEKLAWPKGAILRCPVCLRESEKTAEQMKKYMKKWPKCHKCGVHASVRPL